MSNIVCRGNESELSQCDGSSTPLSCPPQENDAGVICHASSTEKGNCSDGAIRLENGTTVLEGRVEICINNAWGSVCDSTFSEDEANVICNQIGYPYNGEHISLTFNLINNM